jgi:general secretion pathway protein I
MSCRASRADRAPRRRRAALRKASPLARALAASSGFTLIEVVVAVAVLALVLGAIGAVVATNVKGARSIGAKLSALETAQALLAALPQRDALRPGTQTGASGGYRWRIDVVALAPPPPADGRRTLDSEDAAAAAAQVKWVPLVITLRVQGVEGPPVRLDTVRLAPRTGG